jgi:hypothetical protein
MTQVFTIPPKSPRRKIGYYIVLLMLVLAAGYLSRRYAHLLPLLIRKRTGDALWASAVFVLLAILRPKWRTRAVTFAALFISYSIEFSQIYHAPWIDHLRSYALGRLILGTTFFWLDQVAYTVGIVVLIPVDRWLKSRA